MSLFAGIASRIRDTATKRYSRNTRDSNSTTRGLNTTKPTTSYGTTGARYGTGVTTPTSTVHTSGSGGRNTINTPKTSSYSAPKPDPNQFKAGNPTKTPTTTTQRNTPTQAYLDFVNSRKGQELMAPKSNVTPDRQKELEAISSGSSKPSLWNVGANYLSSRFGSDTVKTPDTTSTTPTTPGSDNKWGITDEHRNSFQNFLGGVGDVAGALGDSWEQAKANAGQPEVPNWEQMFYESQQAMEQQQAQFTQQMEGIMGGYESLRNEMASMGAEGAAAYAANFEKVLGNIDQMQAEITQRITSQGGEDDPQMQAALGLIKDEAQRQYSEMLEELNTRGVVQSGLLLEMRDRLNKNELTQTQQLVASRMGDLQQQLNSTIMNFSGARIDAMMSMAQGMNQNSQANMNRLAQMGQAGLQAGMTGAGMIQDNFMKGQDILNRNHMAGMQNETARYGIDQNNWTQRQGQQMDYDTKMYGYDQNAMLTREGYDVTRRGQDMSMEQTRMSTSAQRYAAALGRESEMHLKEAYLKLAQDGQSFNEQQSREANLMSQYGIAQQAMDNLRQAVQDPNSGIASLGDVMGIINSQPFAPEIIRAMTQEAKTFADPRPFGDTGQNNVRPGLTGMSRKYW